MSATPQSCGRYFDKEHATAVVPGVAFVKMALIGVATDHSLVQKLLASMKTSARPVATQSWLDAEWLPLAAITLLLALRVGLLFRHGVDSDEPQCLHVIYSWLRGEVPYRDCFDNHTPLFTWLFLPLARLAGETPNIVLIARLAQIPLSFGAVALFYLLGRKLCGSRVALWATALTLALADWSLKAIEFRPDVLWTVLWFAALWMLVRPGMPGWRTFFPAGLLLGAALMASIKTTVLLAGLGLGWASTWLLDPEFRRAYSVPRIIECAVAVAFGFIVVPAAFLGWFAKHGAYAAMKYCLFTVNEPGGLSTWRLALFVVGCVASILVAIRMRRKGGSGLWIAVFLSAAFYTFLIIGFSPSLKKQTFLPCYPILLLAGADILLASHSRWLTRAPLAICLGLLVYQVIEDAPWHDGMGEQRALLRDALALTSPNEPILDVKGETVFRTRPIYLVYVLATLRGIETGKLQAPSPAGLATTPMVVGGGAGYPDAMRAYIKRHYCLVADGRVRVAVAVPQVSAGAGHAAFHADFPIAGDYVVLRDGRTPAGVIHVDAPGDQMLAIKDAGAVLLYWKNAWDAGYAPAEREIKRLR